MQQQKRLEPFLSSLFCCCTASMKQAVDGAETTAIDGLVLP